MVYFVQAEHGGPIKIGISGDIKKRLAAIQNAHPYLMKIRAVMDGGREEERAVHRRFAATRIGGEWYKPTKELLEFIKSSGRPWDGPVTCHRERGPARKQIVAIQVRGSDAFRQAIEEAAVFAGLSVPDLVDTAIRYYAQQIPFGTPIPER